MNDMLQKDQAEFLIYFEQFKQTYFLFEVDVFYESFIQDLLSQFPPTLRKDFCPGEEQLTQYQKLVKERLGLKMDSRSKMNLQDFKSPQKISVHLPFLALLSRLGISILKIHSVVTATKSALFQNLAQRIFDLKSTSSSKHQREWYKLLGKL